MNLRKKMYILYVVLTIISTCYLLLTSYLGFVKMRFIFCSIATFFSGCSCAYEYVTLDELHQYIRSYYKESDKAEKYYRSQKSFLKFKTAITIVFLVASIVFFCIE